jgi:predicted phage terminase large subunit-like protein
MQRLHVDDLAGHLLDQGGWAHLNLPAVAPCDEEFELGDGVTHYRRQGEILESVRLPLAELEKLKAAMGTFHFSAQYLQDPIPEAGNLVRWEWFGAYDEPPSPTDPGRIVQSWDFAVKDGEQNDWTVCLTAHVRGNVVQILSVFRQRLDYPEQRRSVIRLAHEYGARVILFEAAANGSPLLADLRQLDATGVPTPIPITPRGSKVERLSVHSHRIEAGDVRLPSKAPWLGDFKAEILAFPYGRHDDQADALAQLLSWLESGHNRLPLVPAAPRICVDGVWQ